jgi:hypothetical protein
MGRDSINLSRKLGGHLLRTSSLDLVAVSYLSSKAESFVRTWRGASLEGDDSLVRFLVVWGMVDKKRLVKNLTVNLLFIGRKNLNLPSLTFFLRPQWAMETFVVGWIPISIDYRGWPRITFQVKRGVGQNEGRREDANRCKKF